MPNINKPAAPKIVDSKKHLVLEHQVRTPGTPICLTSNPEFQRTISTDTPSLGTDPSVSEETLVSSSQKKTFYSFREGQTRYLEARFGPNALNEITLLDSGNSVVKDCTFQICKNKTTQKHDLLLTLDYEVTTAKGPLTDLCVEHKTKVSPLQYQREVFLANPDSTLSLLGRKIVTQHQAVPPPNYLPYASISSRVIKLPYLPEIQIYISFLFSLSVYHVGFFLLQKSIRIFK